MLVKWLLKFLVKVVIPDMISGTPQIHHWAVGIHEYRVFDNTIGAMIHKLGHLPLLTVFASHS